MRWHAVLGVALAASSRAAAAQLRLTAGGGSPSNEDVVSQYTGWFPVSKTMQCIMALICQYFLIYTVLVVVRAWRSMSGDPSSWDNSSVVQALEATQNTVNYVPMLCVLFLATRMRAIQLTAGHTERYGLPQWWVQVAMQVCTWAVLGQLLVVLIYPCLFRHVPRTDLDGNCDPPRINNWAGRACLYVFKYVLMVLLYGGFTTVCIGICTMRAPSGLRWELHDEHPAAFCVVMLTVHYFSVYLILAICRIFNDIKRYSHTRCSDTFQLAAYTTNFAPMLCILFIAARVRARQMDHLRGSPQWWAHWCFYVCTFSVMVQTLVVVAVPLIFGGRARKGTSEGDITFQTKPRAVWILLTVFRIVALICLYGGYMAILLSIVFIRHPQGAQYTPLISPAMQCVMVLSFLFFFVYLCLIIVNMVGEPMEKSDDGNTGTNIHEVVQGTLESARHIVILCPMLCILFIALRMRALQMTANRGAPQGWAQDCMYAATWAILLQLVLVVVVSCISSKPSKNVAEGWTTAPSGVSSGTMLYFWIEGCRLFLLSITYGGAVGVMIAFFKMSPATANGRGAQIPVVTVGHLR